MSKILVTGSQGVLGRRLVPELVAAGHSVVGCGRSHLSQDRLWGPAYPYTRADVGEYRQLQEVMGRHGIGPGDYVYHLAAEFGRLNGERYFEQLWRSNVQGTRNVLELQRELGFRLIFASSSEVYAGSPGGDELHEDTPIGRQPNDYAISKWVNECQIMNFEDRYGVECMRLRFFNAYGPGEDYHPYRSVVALFCGAVLRDQNITVYKDYHRAFMYIEDFIPTLARVCGNNFMPGTAVNIGGVDYRSVEELADIVLAEVGKYQKYRGSVVVVPQDRHNVKSKRPNIERARRWFGHDPQVKLEVGVRETVDWMVGTRL